METLKQELNDLKRFAHSTVESNPQNYNTTGPYQTTFNANVMIIELEDLKMKVNILENENQKLRL